MNATKLTRPIGFLSLTAVAICLMANSVAISCDTPVYRYAMYRWDPAPYEVYYFHDKAIDEDAARIHKLLKDAAMSEEKPANLIFIPVNLAEDTDLKRIPPDVRQAWQKQENPTVPTYMVVTPYGHKIYQGDLDEAAVKSMINSKARAAFAKQLEEGKATVLLMVTGADKKANDEAEKVVKDLIKDIADGKIEFYLPPVYSPTGEIQTEAPSIKIGYYRVERDDPKERWLIDSLLAMESDLRDEEFVDKPMIFGIFGRGRALPPFIGKGINRDNLLDCVDFVTGACSCTVKDQNPGMDLLVAYDWYTAAENLANNFGMEEGSEVVFAAEDAYPSLMIPPTEEEVAAADADQEGTGEAPEQAPAAGANAEANAESAGDAPASPAADDTSGDARETSTDESAKQPAEESHAEDETLVAVSEPAMTESPEDKAGGPENESQQEEAAASNGAESNGADDVASTASSGEESTASDNELALNAAPAANTTQAAEAKGVASVFVVGAGIGIALLLLFGATFFVLRPR